VIRIRYLDLSAGMHGRAWSAGRTTTVYLCPGLTGAQRSGALRRLRQESRMGCGPRLPAGPLAVAIGADWIRTAAARLIAIVRLHPAVALAPALLLGVTAALLLASAGSQGDPWRHGPHARHCGNISAYRHSCP
jgi:hypothetical protein